MSRRRGLVLSVGCWLFGTEGGGGKRVAGWVGLYTLALSTGLQARYLLLRKAELGSSSTHRQAVSRLAEGVPSEALHSRRRTRRSG